MKRPVAPESRKVGFDFPSYREWLKWTVNLAAHQVAELTCIDECAHIGCWLRREWLSHERTLSLLDKDDPL